MKWIHSSRFQLSLLTAAVLLGSIVVSNAQGRGRGGRGGMTDRQATALENLSVQNYGEMKAVNEASEALARTAFTVPSSAAEIRAKGEALSAAQLKWAIKQSNLFAEIQASDILRLPDTSVAQLTQGGGGGAAAGGRGGGGGGAAGGGARGGAGLVVAGASAEQQTAIAQMEQGLAMVVQAAATARTDLIAASLADPANQTEVLTKLAALRNAERALANARADAFGTLQSSANKLTPEQVQALISAQSAPRGAGARAGGRGAAGGGGRGAAP